MLNTTGASVAGILMLAGAMVAFGQQTSPTPAAPSNPPTRSQKQQEPSVPQIRFPGTTAPLSNSASGVLTPAYLTPIYGLQGVLAETLDGRTLAAQSVGDKFNPASAIKLATALAALQTFGPQYRFVTSVWANGKIDSATGILTGDLIVTGRDPAFHYEHAVMLARELNRLGIRSVTGKLIVAPGFTMNFDWSASRSGEELRDTLDGVRRPITATQAWNDQLRFVGDTAGLQTVPSVVVSGGAQVGTAPPEAEPLFAHKSSRLVDILKVLLCYSNNFMAERIGDTLGGPQVVRTLLTEKLKVNPDEVWISSTSGVGVNRITPRAMMKVLRALRDELQKNKLALSDVLPVAGIDPGTLEDRYTDAASRGSVVAKTGTLVRTDGGASSLVGQARTRSGSVVLFVIMNQHGSVLRFRENQDAIVTAIQNALGGPTPFDYRPVTLAMRLADSEYAAAKARGEYEPRNQR